MPPGPGNRCTGRAAPTRLARPFSPAWEAATREANDGHFGRVRRRSQGLAEDRRRAATESPRGWPDSRVCGQELPRARARVRARARGFFLSFLHARAIRHWSSLGGFESLLVVGTRCGRSQISRSCVLLLTRLKCHLLDQHLPRRPLPGPGPSEGPSSKGN